MTSERCSFATEIEQLFYNKENVMAAAEKKEGELTFFVVTLNSLYKVAIKEVEVVLEKIGILSSKKSTAKNGDKKYGEKLLVEKDLKLEKRVEKGKEVAYTSLVVALFLSEDEAIACGKDEKRAPCDSRWKNSTCETLTAINNLNSPHVYIAKDENQLLAPGEWEHSYRLK